MEIRDHYPVEQSIFDAELTRQLTVSVDGVPRSRVIAYDIAGGVVLRAKTDEQHNVLIDFVSGEVLVERLNGVVTVDRGDPALDA